MALGDFFSILWTERRFSSVERSGRNTHTEILNSRLSRLYLTSVRQLLFESISPKPQRFRYGRDDGAFTRLLKKVSRYFKILCAPVFIFSRGSSALLVGHPRCGLSIWLSLLICHIQYTFLSLCQCFSRENGQNTKILEVRHFRTIRKRRAKH